MNLPSPIRVVSSMATRRLLAELTAQFEATSSHRVSLESIGGVDAAKRVSAGEAFDLVVLAKDAIENLTAASRIIAGSRIDVAVSPIALAVPAGTPHPDIGSAEGVKRAVLSARSVGYSTGPSGAYLAKLFKTWDTEDRLQNRITVAPAGVPVGSLVARGEIELGFQQLSELIGVDGIEVVGLLPQEIQAITTFSGGIAQTSTQPDAARALLSFMAGPEHIPIKRKYGMDAAAPSA
ncbi:MAG TPA: substrate-binding domain-containing protein [Vicinamibacterales bacterium]|nr:substrate-binding domain-containing protein [Vicinamibacterales bacterium]